MYLIQILLPLYDNDEQPFGRPPFDRVRRELTERFGGVTMHMRAPASGAWKEDGGHVEHDDVVIVEVMEDEPDRAWWAGYRAELEARFRQDEVVIRALPGERL
jgi:hypothetical protein